MSSPNFDPDEQRLRILFQGLKQKDARRIPEFSAILSRTGKQSSRRYAGQSALALIGSVLLFLAAIYAVEEYGKNQDVTDPSISQWQSPTAFLLHSPDERFLTSVPEFGKPLIPFTQPSINTEAL
ncbi:MAG: hypothetical protein HYW57_09150 [Ignavibacteriales bacterium]|nr:hypothetical protein [Ignavibacteriales bacterium]